MASPSLDILETAMRLFSAALLAGLLGVDRELRSKTMGLRTFMLIATGTALFTVLALEMTAVAGSNVEIDPTRILQGIVAGIGLIAMGGVMHRDDRVRGATTGASVWVIGSIGIACGLGLYMAAIVATAIAAFILIGLGILERLIKRRAGRTCKRAGLWSVFLRNPRIVFFGHIWATPSRLHCIWLFRLNGEDYHEPVLP